MIDASPIREPLEVVGSDDKHVGRADRVMGTGIERVKLDLGGRFTHHLVPTARVDFVDDDRVHLSLTADAAKAAWR